MFVVEVKKQEAVKWNNFVKTAPGGSLLQSWEWGDIKEKFGWKPYRLALVEAYAGKMSEVGVGDILATALVLQKNLPRKKSFLYVPFGPVFSANPWEFDRIKTLMSLMLEKISEIAKRERAIFLRIDPPFPKIEFDAKILRQLGFRKSFEEIQPETTQKVDLTLSDEELLAQMKPKGRYNIRLAERHKVKVEESKGPVGIRIFLDLYEETSRRDRFTTHSREYLTEVMNTLFRRDLGRLFIARFQNIPVAAIVVSFFGNTAIYLYGASSSQHREVMGSYLVHWKAMKEAKRRRCKKYDLWGIAPTDNPNHPWAGLRRFKTQFGGRQIDYIGAYDFVYNKPWYFVFKLAELARRKLAKKLKV